MFDTIRLAAFITQMPIELSHLMQLAMGQKSELPVGDLPRPVAEYLKCHPAIVYLGYGQFYKIARQHKEITQEVFQILSMMIRNGTYIKDNARRNCVTVFYKESLSQKIYTAGIKSAQSGGEAWVQTFHRTTNKKARAREIRHGFLHGPKHYRK